MDFFRARIGKPMTDSPSPFATWLEGTLIEVAEGYLKVSFEVRREMTNAVGILHGGVSAGMLDEVLGAMIYTLGNEYVFVTVNLSVDYIGMAKIGDTLTAEARVVRKGRSIINAEATLHNAEGKLVAKATTNYAVTNIPIGGKK